MEEVEGGTEHEGEGDAPEADIAITAPAGDEEAKPDAATVSETGTETGTEPPSEGNSVPVPWFKIACAKASHIRSGQAAAAAVRNLPSTLPVNVLFALLGPNGPS